METKLASNSTFPHGVVIRIGIFYSSGDTGYVKLSLEVRRVLQPNMLPLSQETLEDMWNPF